MEKPMEKALFLLFVLLNIIISPLKASWAEDTLAFMSLKEKVGQLFMASAATKLSGFEKNIDLEAYYCDLINDCQIGGFALFSGELQDQISFVNKVQSCSKIPLLIGQDCEWGLNMRLKNTLEFPKNMTLGAIKDDNLIFNVGKEIGKQCRKVGVHINFGPVVDVNTNPNNPIIGIRSFGADRYNVAHKGTLLMRGLQAGGVFACAKHFPGHGDTETDSHLSLPVINHDMYRLQAEELYPFKILIDAGVDAIMTAHIAIPALGCPSNSSLLCKNVITRLLHEELGFNGLTITDGMTMKGVSSFYAPHDAALQALLAGNDIILGPPMIKKCIEHVMQAVNGGIFPITELNKKVLKILTAKEKFGLHKERLVATTTTTETITTPKALRLKADLFKKAITISHNESKLLPLVTMYAQQSTGFINVGKPAVTDELGEDLALDADSNILQSVIRSLHDYETIVIRLFQASATQSKYGRIPSLAPALEELITTLENNNKQLIIMLVTTPYALFFLPRVPTIVAYENNPDALKAAMDVLWGKAPAEGILPINLV